jgi:hypothetical protein
MAISRSLSLAIGEMRARRARLFALAGVVVVALFFFLGLAAKPAHASTFTVTNTEDSGAGSLRDAITKANASAAADTIDFNIPSIIDPNCDALSRVCTIYPFTSLPEISAPVIINGYSQPGSSPNTLATGSNAQLMIELSGAHTIPTVTPLDGLKIGAPNVVVKGLAINEWTGDGIEVEGPSTTNTRIEGNFIGTDASGAQKKGNGVSGVGSGVYVLGTPSTVVGGTPAAAHNVISGNVHGVTAQASNTRVQGNLIGTDKTGSGNLGNSFYGVWLYYADKAVIGGTTSGARNVISGNGASGSGVASGVYVYGSGATKNTIEGNYIGTDANGTAKLGNPWGVRIEQAPNNVVGGTSAGARNLISGNVFNGVAVYGSGATGNSILTNSIFGNGWLGIDLDGFGAVIPNDPGDPDVGPNNLQNFPEISSATKKGKGTIIGGTLNSTPNTTFTVQFFSSPEADTSSGYGEGKTFAGEQTSVTTDENGDASFSIRVARSKAPVGSVVTSTATDSDGNTSEFSKAVVVS